MSLRESLAPAGEDVKTATAPAPPRAGRPKSCRPFSWLLARDVEQCRDELNFSTWDEDADDADDADDAVAEGSMPPRRSGGG